MIDASEFRLPAKATNKSHMIPRIERTIDKAILKSSGKKSEVRVSVQRSWMRHEITTVLQKYAAVGWDAKLVFDDTSGDYIILSPAQSQAAA